jgi:IMP cyclohydrolase
MANGVDVRQAAITAVFRGFPELDIMMLELYALMYENDDYNRRWVVAACPAGIACHGKIVG